MNRNGVLVVCVTLRMTACVEGSLWNTVGLVLKSKKVLLCSLHRHRVPVRRGKGQPRVCVEVVSVQSVFAWALHQPSMS